MICVNLVQENTSDLFKEVFCLFDFYRLMFVILLLSLFCITDDELSLLSGDYQDLLKGNLEEIDVWMNDEELFDELQELPGKNTSEKPQQSSADVSEAWGKTPLRLEEITSTENVNLVGEPIMSKEDWESKTSNLRRRK